MCSLLAMRWMRSGAVSKLLPLFLLLDLHVAYATSLPEPSVTISAGVVVGTSLAGSVNAFLGVPFAQPPERFAPPNPAAPWASPLRAQALPPACIQQFSGPEPVAARTKSYFNNPYRDPPEESEDCLYLNIYAPPTASPTNKKAVLFWLYGGNLQFGTSSLAYYDGRVLAANEEVVVVTINYRTNIFGFSNSPEVAFGQQNSGFLDQRLALQWVQDNILEFGGDPEQVTIFGESAGAYSARQLLANPPSPLPFSGAILQSVGLRMLGNSTNNYGKVASHFNCSAAPSTLECLRKVPAESIKKFIETNELDFAPVDGDGTQTRDLTSSVAGRKLARVPVMIGSNANEGSVFLRILGLDEGTHMAASLLGRLGLASSSYVPDSFRHYLARAFDGVFHFSDRVLTGAFYDCPTTAFAQQLAASDYTVWQYYYSLTFPSVELFPNCGAYHSAEIPLVFGSYDKSHGHVAEPELQHLLSKHMQHVWATFARQGELDAPASAPALGFELVKLRADGTTGLNSTSRRGGDLVCTLAEKIVKPLLG